jgi:hypothetical protein
MSDLKVGDKVWLFDQNRRVYKTDSIISSAPIFSEYFYQTTITGETSRSWIIDREKFSKKTLQGIYTDEMKADKIWEEENRYRIVEEVRYCSIDKLKKIALILGE